MSPASLTVENLSAGYGRKRVLKDLSLVLAPRTILALVGTNGCGKTTLFNAVMGYVRPSRGTVRLEGRDVTGQRPDQMIRAGVGFVAQRDTMFREMSVEENISMGGYTLTRHRRQERLPEIWKIFPELADMRARRAENLSGGERQLVKLARTLMVEPSVLLLDEPTAGLSVGNVARMLDVLRGLTTEQGIALLLIEQNVAAALQVADEVAWLHGGTVAWRDSAERFATDRIAEAIVRGRPPTSTSASAEGSS